jgi:hypothetical protein
MAPPEAVRKAKIIVQFVQPGENGSPPKIVDELEVLVDMPVPR